MYVCTDWWSVLHYVSAVGEVGEDGVHVLNIIDGNCQISQTRERTPFILVLLQRKQVDMFYLALELTQ